MSKNFILTITGREGGELQGIIGKPGGKEVRFRSILELLRLLRTLMDTENTEE